MDPIKLAMIMAAIIEELSDRGVRVEFQRNIADLYKLHGRLEEKSLSPLFSPDLFDLTEENSFWIAGIGDDRTLVHVQALKLDDTGRQPLSNLLNRQLGRAFEGDEPLWRCNALDEISGRCVYQGDLWVSNRYAARSTGPLLVRLGMLAAICRWDPDFIYAFFENNSAYGALAFRGWYPHYERIGQLWQGWLHENEWIGWISYEDAVSLIELETSESATSLR